MGDAVTLTGIAYPEKALKKDLWKVIKDSRRPPEYVIDKIAEEKGELCEHYSSVIIYNINRSWGGKTARSTLWVKPHWDGVESGKGPCQREQQEVQNDLETLWLILMFM